MKIDAVNQRDTNMVTGAILLTTVGISFLLLLVDLTYAMVDPRLKSMYAKKKGGH
jgi:ABC-type dipeptide/oligopeptide/nickel transport system permease component